LFFDGDTLLDKSVTTGSSLSLALTTTQTNDLLVAILTNDGGKPDALPSDTWGLTWTNRTFNPLPDGIGQTEYYALSGANSGTDTVTFTFSSDPVEATGGVFAVANVDVAYPLDSGSGVPAVTNGTGSGFTQTATTVDPDDLLLPMGSMNNSAELYGELVPGKGTPRVAANGVDTLTFVGGTTTPVDIATTYGVTWSFLDAYHNPFTLNYGGILDFAVQTVEAAAPTSTAAAVEYGQPVTFTAHASGGTGVYSTYAWTGLPPDCTGTTTANPVCTPTSGAGPYSVGYTVTDSNSVTSSASASLSFTVNAGPTITTPTPSPGSGLIDVGQSVTFTTSASGGSGSPFTFTWSQSSSDFGCNLASTADSMSCTPTTAGPYTVSVYVADKNGGLSPIAGSASFMVVSLPSVATPAPSPASGTIDVGGMVTFTTSSSGGSGGPYVYTWSQSSSNFGCNLVSTTDSMACFPTAGGSFTVTVFAADSNGGDSASMTSGSYLVYSDPTTTVPAPSQPGADLGQTITFSTTPSGGDGFYQMFTWGESSGFLGCALVNAATISCTPTATGTYHETVKVTDTNGFSSSFETSGDFIVSADPSTTFPFPSHPSVDVGQTVTFSTTTSYGMTPYSYDWRGLPTGCTTSNVAALVCTPTGVGTFSLYVVVTDANGYMVNSGTLDYTVYSDPTITTPIAVPLSVDVGQTVTFTTTASGGLAPYTYFWLNLPAGCPAANANHITCTPTAPTGTHSVSVEIDDSNGKGAGSGILSFTVYADPTVATPVPSHPGADIGELVTFNAATTGGAPPLSYVWHGLPYGCSSSNVDPLLCTPKSGGNFMIYVVVTDADHETVTSGTLAFSTVQGLDVHTPFVNHNTGKIGESVTFSVHASTFGKAPYTYSWNGLPGGCVSANSLTITCTLTAPTGTFHVSVTTTDANGAVKTSAALKFIVKS